MTSEKRLAANRRNAQKSTGPRTQEGKSRSRENSLKHGLTGDGVVLNEDDANAIDAKCAEFAAFIQPANPVEHELVERMSLASVRMKRCRHEDEARFENRQAAAEHDWAVDRKTRLQTAILHFEDDCTRGYRMLKNVTLGCEWLRKQWEELAAVLEEQGYWEDIDVALAQQLIGSDPNAPNEGNAAACLIRYQNVLARRAFDHAPLVESLQAVGTMSADEVQAMLKESFGDAEPDPAQALQRLRDFVAARIAYLVNRAETLWHEHEKPARDQARKLATVDLSADAMRLARYDSMNELSFHRNWNAILKLRKLGVEKLGMASEAAQEPAPAVAQNEPIVEHSSPESADICACSQERAEAVTEASPLDERPTEALAADFEPAVTAFEALTLPVGSA